MQIHAFDTAFLFSWFSCRLHCNFSRKLLDTNAASSEKGFQSGLEGPSLIHFFHTWALEPPRPRLGLPTKGFNLQGLIWTVATLLQVQLFAGCTLLGRLGRVRNRDLVIYWLCCSLSSFAYVFSMQLQYLSFCFFRSPRCLSHFGPSFPAVGAVQERQDTAISSGSAASLLLPESRFSVLSISTKLRTSPIIQKKNRRSRTPLISERPYQIF